MRFSSYGSYLQQMVPTIAWHQTGEELALSIPVEVVEPVIWFLKKHTLTQIDQLSDMTAVDYPSQTPRFEVQYQFLSLGWNRRLTLKIRVTQDQPIPSVVALYPNANWFEREIWDLFGLFFAHHPDLRRLLTDYGFEGYPLRKDFPLSGFLEVRYDETTKRLLYEPVFLTQAFRTFSFQNPWGS